MTEICSFHFKLQLSILANKDFTQMDFRENKIVQEKKI